LKEAIQKIQRQLGKTRGDWLVADAEYLLSVANRRLHLMGDVSTTQEALTAADQRLRESGDTAAFKVREQITKEIAALKKIELPDIVGIYSTLESLEDDVDKLTLFLPYAGKELTKTDQQQQDESQNQDDKQKHEGLDEVILELEGLLTIRHTEQPVKAIITAAEAQFLRDQLRVKLEMVKISMVQQNDLLYQATLKDAQQWVIKNYTRNKDADSFLADLDKLSQIKIHSQFPDISGSLKMLRDITKLRIETDKALHKEVNGKQMKTAVSKALPAVTPDSNAINEEQQMAAPVLSPVNEEQQKTLPVAKDQELPEQIQPETPEQSIVE
jgi:uncharacterized protein HemX